MNTAINKSESEIPQFVLKDCALTAIATDNRANTLKEFRDRIENLNPDSLYYHFWANLLLPRFEEREYINDFASWVRQGFGLTVTEALWKGKPVIGGDTGGIRLQVINFHTGFLVATPEGAALRIRYLFNEKQKMQEMGLKAKEFVRENFLLTRQLREHLTLMVSLLHGSIDRLNLG